MLLAPQEFITGFQLPFTSEKIEAVVWTFLKTYGTDTGCGILTVHKQALF